MVTIAIKCHMCKEAIDTGLSREKFERVLNRQGHIQNEFPEIPPSIRELFISGVCGNCMDILFSEEGKE